MRRIALVSLLALAAGGFALERATRPAPPPDFASVRAAHRPSEAYLLDRDGRLLQSLRMDYTVRRLPWAAWAEISPALRGAVIHAEDRRFDEHAGVDWRAFASALAGVVRGNRLRGASTLTMQLADLLVAAPRGALRRSPLEKLVQVRAALALERHWSKAQIVEGYLNLVSFRGEYQGIAAISQALFGKHPAGLSADESVALAALLPAPGASAGRVATRACALANREDCEPLRALVQAALAQPRAIAPAADQAPHLARRLLRQPGERIRSTLDARIQAIAHDALARQLAALQARNVRDGAAVVLDNASGDVLAYVGAAGAASRSPAVDGVRAVRQAGSTLKPFLYALALERGYLTPASLLDDSPLQLDTGSGLYIPNNYDRGFHGLVTVRAALAGSFNIPAVRSLVLVGLEPFRERLHDLGYAQGLTESGEYYGYSLALGSVEVSLIEQANAYRTLANGGHLTPLRLRPDDPVAPSRQIVAPAAAFIVGDILADRAARASTFGLDGPLTTAYWSAAKTGTSKDLRDNWCVGWSTRYTVAVWVGNFEGDSMQDVSGVDGAAPAWHEIMNALPQEQASPAAPAGLTRQRVALSDAGEPDREEWFVTGTQLSRSAAAADTGMPAITMPARGMVVALDPDIPQAQQHLTFRAAGGVAHAFELDGTVVAGAAAPYLWSPAPGRHVLRLVSAEGRELDRVEFEVRGPS